MPDTNSTLQRNLPLYKKLVQFNGPEKNPFIDNELIHQPHIGLLFDKYIDTWVENERGIFQVDEK